MVDRTMYSFGADGKWHKTVWSEQCPFKFLFGKSRCQGVTDHDGPHWHYKADGSFSWHLREKDMTGDPRQGVAGWVPPDNEHYIEPKVQFKNYHLSHSKTEVVTDEKLLARLNDPNDDMEGAVVDRPVSTDTLRWLREEGLLPWLDDDDEEDLQG